MAGKSAFSQSPAEGGASGLKALRAFGKSFRSRRVFAIWNSRDGHKRKPRIVYPLPRLNPVLLNIHGLRNTINAAFNSLFN